MTIQLKVSREKAIREIKNHIEAGEKIHQEVKERSESMGAYTGKEHRRESYGKSVDWMSFASALLGASFDRESLEAQPFMREYKFPEFWYPPNYGVEPTVRLLKIIQKQLLLEGEDKEDGPEKINSRFPRIDGLGSRALEPAPLRRHGRSPGFIKSVLAGRG